MRKTHASRILALDLRAHRIGYAVLEGANRLLDFGASEFGSPKMARERVRALAKIFCPFVIVVDTGAARGRRDKRRTALMIRAIRRMARLQSVPVAVTSGRALRRFFTLRGLRNKYDFAVLAATWFPQLASRVPPKRKCYDSEPPIMISFDALAVGSAYLAAQHHGSG